jgi:hypothetical protein
MTMHLTSSLFDTIRIPRRETAALIGDRMCREAGFDVDVVQQVDVAKRHVPPGLTQLRCRIALAMRQGGVSQYDIEHWFIGATTNTIRRYISDARAMEAAE